MRFGSAVARRSTVPVTSSAAAICLDQRNRVCARSSQVSVRCRALRRAFVCVAAGIPNGTKRRLPLKAPSDHLRAARTKPPTLRQPIPTTAIPIFEVLNNRDCARSQSSKSQQASTGGNLHHGSSSGSGTVLSAPRWVQAQFARLSRRISTGPLLIEARRRRRPQQAASALSIS